MNSIRYCAGTGRWKNWIVEESGFDERFLGKGESIFSQGNGYMGLRAAREEVYADETRDWFVNGVFDDFDGEEVTELANLPDVSAVSIRVGGARFHLDGGSVCSDTRRLNLRTGEMNRLVEWKAPNGTAVRLRFSRLVSLDRLHILAQRIEITPVNAAAQIEIESGVNARVTNSGTQHFSDGEKRIIDGRFLQLAQHTVRSRIPAVIHTVHRLTLGGAPLAQEPFPVMERRRLKLRWSYDLPQGETLTVEKISSVHTSRDLEEAGTSEPDAGRIAARGLADIRKADAVGYAGLEQENEQAWERYWENADIRVENADRDQLAIRFALYHMRICYGSGDNRLGIGAKALSGEGYKGHSFWDTEIFLLPFYIFMRPQDARRLLEYRYLGRDAARRKAEENGCEGMMFPWESAWVDDGEVTPLWGGVDIRTGTATRILTGQIEIHITADIAYAVAEYYRVTGDRDFMERYGYEMILETGRFWAARAEWNDKNGRYELHDVIGPDEYKEHADNNAYTNYMACYNMDLALQTEKTLRRENPALYRSLSDRLRLPELTAGIQKVRSRFYLPSANADGIIPQDDRYLQYKEIDLAPYKKAELVGTVYNDYNAEEISRMQISKQADVVMLLTLLPQYFETEIRNRNYAFYESHTLHDSSLSFASHSLLAAQLGRTQEAYSLFQRACAVDLGPGMRSSQEGIHAASMGGIWQDVVLGFCGVSQTENGVSLSPHLPEKWGKVEFSVIYRGNRIAFAVSHAEISAHNQGKNAVPLCLPDGSVQLAAGASHLCRLQ